MEAIEETVVVATPVSRAYTGWTEFQSLPVHLSNPAASRQFPGSHSRTEEVWRHVDSRTGMRAGQGTAWLSLDGELPHRGGGLLSAGCRQHQSLSTFHVAAHCACPRHHGRNHPGGPRAVQRLHGIPAGPPVNDRSSRVTPGSRGTKGLFPTSVACEGTATTGGRAPVSEGASPPAPFTRPC